VDAMVFLKLKKYISSAIYAVVFQCLGLFARRHIFYSASAAVSLLEKFFVLVQETIAERRHERCEI
jgi:hypothetical protein